MTRRRFERHAAHDEQVLRVELRGEVADWRSGLAVPPDGVELDLPPGIYAYKFLVWTKDGEARWEIDRAEPRTRSAGGHQNSIAVVDGAPEPWLFAPALPWIVPLERGGVRVVVGLRETAPRSADATPTIGWSEDGGRTWTRTRTRTIDAFIEDEHRFYAATLATSAATGCVVLDAPGAPRFEASWSRPPAASLLPSWWKSARLYTIFIDRFRPEEDRLGWERDPGRRVAAGGHLEGIRRSLDELAELGIDVLYLTPVHVGASSHRYDVVDARRIDPALGGEESYAALIRDARGRGMRIVQDLSFAHAGRGFPPYEDVRANGAGSRFAPWFQWRDDALVHYGKRTDAPLFDLTCPEVAELVLETVDDWARRGVSGLRIDMAAEVPLELGRRIRRRFKDLVPDGVVFGELVPHHAWRWRAAGALDAATDFSFHEAVTDLVVRPGASAAEAFAKLLASELVRGDDATVHAVRFLSTHDHVRLATRLAAAADPLALRRLGCAYALLATMPGVPMLLYGEEHALRSHEPDRDPENAWPDRMPMPWTDARRDPATAATLKALLRARARSPALRSGRTELLFADRSTLVFRREADGDAVDVAINFATGADDKVLAIEDDARPRLIPLAAVGGAVAAEDATQTLRLPPCSAILVRREQTVAAPARVSARRNLVLRDADLVAGRGEAAARPSRFFFAVTERCNLRCEHCITHAPERTRSGQARTMTPAVLDALAEDFAFADYFAFVHGGESLTAPIFFDLLAAIARARAGAPYVAHLLTNGLLLDAAMAKRLVSAGVSSVSVSLDGATAETNDAIRVGGRFERIRDNLAAVLAWRRAEGADLRVGISSVVLAQNVAELGALVDLAADLGVDWIKLEEGAPATPFAKRSLVATDAPEPRRAIDAAVARGAERSVLSARQGKPRLVVVDHTRERAVWRCRLDDETRRFLEADEHANRGPIHPCRTPWETVCIEPNGDVRGRDFFGPILGNATQTPLARLWNAERAQALRREAVASRLCGSGPVVCVDPES